MHSDDKETPSDPNETKATVNLPRESSPEPAREKVHAPDRGESIGRFVVLDTLGSGGMGVVVSAYDPNLDRKVAIKLLHTRAAGPKGSEAAKTRLMREARAMGKIRHPNVVTVYEVGTFLDQVFVAMEHVDGGTLRQHLKDHPEMSWREIVAMYAKAGRGLAAAHAAGMVHRDFKPENVLIEEDRVQVADFGLVGMEVEPEAPLAQSQGQDSERQSQSKGLTRARSVTGTPAYMAPEQHLGRRADARADQYAFCIALYVAIYKSHPFGDPRAPEFVERKLAGKLVPQPAVGSVPTWLYDCITRGFKRKTKDRYENMNELLEVLEQTSDDHVGQGTRLVVGALFGTVFTARPMLGGEYGIPVPIETALDVVTMQCTFLAMLGIATWFTRRVMLGTAYNRSLVSMLGITIVGGIFTAWIANSLGLGMRSSAILHASQWALAAWFFTVAVDRRLILAAIGFTVALCIAIVRLDLVYYMMSTSSFILVLNLALMWMERKGSAAPASGSSADEIAAAAAETVQE
jgi:hypothetical protein